MIGLRWKIGPDWDGYQEIFRQVQLFTVDQAIARQDPGFMLLNVVLHTLAAPFWIVNLVCGCIFVWGLSAFCLRQYNPWLAFLVAFPYLVIVVAMSGDRQSAAIGLLFLALNAFERGRLNRFVALVLIAALFHASASLVLPLCLLAYGRNKLQQALLLLITVGIGYYFFLNAYDVYAVRYSAEHLQSSGTAYRLAMNALAAVLFLFFSRRFGLDEHQRKLWRNMSLATFVLGLLLIVIPSSTAIDRFLLYLFPLQLFVLSRLPSSLTRERKAIGQNTLAVIAYAAVVQFAFLEFGTFASSYVPYRSILSV